MTDELYIFGSATRGEVSPSSDIDVLVVSDSPDRRAYPESWSIYSTELLETYYRDGRLFAWHLHLEAIRIFPREAPGILCQLGDPAPYVTARKDVLDLKTILEQAVSEISSTTANLIYELGIAYTAIRDIAMSASWSLLGKPNFSAYVPFELPIRVPLPMDSYRAMMVARHCSTRGTTPPSDPPSLGKGLCESRILDWAENIRNAV